MKQSLQFITLGVKDLEKMKKFYNEKFGWKPKKDDGGIVFYKMNGFILSLFPEEELAKDAGVSPENSGFAGFSLAVNFNSEKEVDEAFAEMSAGNVKIVKKPQKVFWGGYSGYVEDPEHHLWELAYNPFLEMDSDGVVISHK